MRRRMNRSLWLIPLGALLAGCPVTQPPPPGPVQHLTEKTTGRKYSLYVPTHYTPKRKWPLVITLHGTHGWDGRKRQINEGGELAERKGFLVAAPYLKSPQGILPVIHSIWSKQLDADDKAILGMIDDLQAKYTIDPRAVLLTGFSAGGYPMYNTGLRHPERFNMLIARACNSSIWLFERIRFTEAARNMPIFIFWGKDDLKPLQEQSWQAFRYLRGSRRCFNTEKKEVHGGHLRRPETAWNLWQKHIPAEYHDKDDDD